MKIHKRVIDLYCRSSDIKSVSKLSDPSSQPTKSTPVWTFTSICSLTSERFNYIKFLNKMATPPPPPPRQIARIPPPPPGKIAPKKPKASQQAEIKAESSQKSRQRVLVRGWI